MHILKAENLVKTFKLSERQRKNLGLKSREKVAVNGVSFTAQSGEVFGLLGPNGAGKTTTMRMLSTLINPDSGDIYYDNINIKKDSQKVRSQIAFLTSDLKLDMKSTANSMYDFFSDLYGIPKATAKQRKEEMFERFGINMFADTLIGKLSQGQRQKVSLVVSVLHDPDFIIFDEPTNGLDIISTRFVREFILKMKEEGKCIIISTHLFDLVEKVCDRAAFIIEGKLILDEKIDLLTKEKSLEDVFYDYYIKFGEENQK